MFWREKNYFPYGIRTSDPSLVAITATLLQLPETLCYCNIHFNQPMGKIQSGVPSTLHKAASMWLVADSYAIL